MAILQVPLLDNADTVKELHEFLDGAPSVPAESVKKGQAKAQNMAQARQASEESVSNSKPADTELLANYMAYSKLEEVSLRCLVDKNHLYQGQQDHRLRCQVF